MSSTAYPVELKLRNVSRLLEITFDDGQRFDLPFEYLRVYSPSAEVRGHGPGQEVWPVGKAAVGIERVEPIGNYAVRLCFDDGHDTGLYTWAYLHELCVQHEEKWRQYVERTREAAE
ncbi:DUF971 domain-containing protein [soil metagenome]